MTPLLGGSSYSYATAFFPSLAFLFAMPAVVIVILFWSLFWKAWALWLAARRGEKIWFGALLLINTAGVLEMIYIFLVAKRSDKPETHGK